LKQPGKTSRGITFCGAPRFPWSDACSSLAILRVTYLGEVKQRQNVTSSLPDTARPERHRDAADGRGPQAEPRTGQEVNSGLADATTALHRKLLPLHNADKAILPWLSECPLRVYSVEKLVSRYSCSNFWGLQTINRFVCVALRAFWRVDFFDDTHLRYYK